MPTDAVGKEELAIEADFYGLDGLVKAIRMPKVDISSLLTKETLLQREEESILRKAFANREATASQGFQGLIPIFDPEDGIQPLPLNFDPDSQTRNEAHMFMGELRQNPKTEKGQPLLVTVKTLDEFQTNFNREWPNLLHRLNEVLLEEPIVIAGGSILRALTASKGVRTEGWWGKTSDIDLFLCCSDREEANRIARRIFYALAVDNEKWIILRCRGVVNIHKIIPHYVETRVQVVLRLYDSLSEILVGFDVDCCCCAYDGRNVWLTPRCVSALQSGVNVLNPLHAWPNQPSYELRLAKYANRGFAVSVPGIDSNRIDFSWIHQSDLRNLKGLARFMKIASEMDSATLCKRHQWVNREWQTVECPRTPREVATLREEVRNGTSADERLIFAWGDHSDMYNDATDVLVPSVYGVEPRPVDWTYDDNFPLSRHSRDNAWEEIVDAGEEHPERVARRLVDAWETEKRSREYLNGTMDKFDLDNLYYSKAYKDEAD